jgi:hypothetical protein
LLGVQGDAQRNFTGTRDNPRIGCFAGNSERPNQKFLQLWQVAAVVAECRRMAKSKSKKTSA